MSGALLLLLASAACLLASAAPGVDAFVARVVRRSPPHRAAFVDPAAQLEWSAEEDAALIERVPSFTAGSGAGVATFWSALAVGSEALALRSPADCETRMRALELGGCCRQMGSTNECESAVSDADAEGAAAAMLPPHRSERALPPHGGEPPVLDSWEALPRGRYAGWLDGRRVWLDVALEGRLASDPRCCPGCVFSYHVLYPARRTARCKCGIMCLARLDTSRSLEDA